MPNKHIMEQPHHHHRLVFHPASVSSSHTHHHFHHHHHPRPHHHCHHHHHFHHTVLPKCALHNNFSQTSNSKLCPNLSPPLPQIPTPPASTIPLLRSSSLQPPPPPQDIKNIQDDGVGEYEEEEEEDAVFVMTDEWRDFFAKAEGKRRAAKKLAKKQGKR
uniref:Uncharacterized protein n=1 Tax=Salicornia brachiata TaxID=179119 RepID=F8UXA3_9CARY|nr:unknown [Salicornia brachiata]